LAGFVDDLIVDDTTIGIGRPAAAPYSLVWTPNAAKPFAFYGDKDGALPPGAPSDLREIAGRYQSYARVIADFDAAWKAVEPHLAPALGHLSGKQKNDAELAAFKTGMATGLSEGGGPRRGLQNGPAEFTLGLNDYTPVDPEQQKKWTGPVAASRSDDGDGRWAAGDGSRRYAPGARARCRP
jgi:hypothetical protein